MGKTRPFAWWGFFWGALIVEEEADEVGGQEGFLDVDDESDEHHFVVAFELGPHFVEAWFGEDDAEGNVGAGAGVLVGRVQLLGVAVQIDLGVLRDVNAVGHGGEVGLEIDDGLAVLGQADHEVGFDSGNGRAGLEEKFRGDGGIGREGFCQGGRGREIGGIDQQFGGLAFCVDGDGKAEDLVVLADGGDVGIEEIDAGRRESVGEDEGAIGLHLRMDVVEEGEVGGDDDEVEEVFVDGHQVAEELALFEGREAEEGLFAGDGVARRELHVIVGGVEGCGGRSADGDEGHSAEGADAGGDGDDAVVHGALVLGEFVGGDGDDQAGDPGVEVAHFFLAVDG